MYSFILFPGFEGFNNQAFLHQTFTVGFRWLETRHQFLINLFFFSYIFTIIMIRFFIFCSEIKQHVPGPISGHEAQVRCSFIWWIILSCCSVRQTCQKLTCQRKSLIKPRMMNIHWGNNHRKTPQTTKPCPWSETFITSCFPRTTCHEGTKEW